MRYDEKFSTLLKKYFYPTERSEAWLAKAIGCTRSTVNRWLNGVTLPSKPEIVTKMADAVGVRGPGKRGELLRKAGFINYNPSPLYLFPALATGATRIFGCAAARAWRQIHRA